MPLAVCAKKYITLRVPSGHHVSAHVAKKFTTLPFLFGKSDFRQAHTLFKHKFLARNVSPTSAAN